MRHRIAGWLVIGLWPFLWLTCSIAQDGDSVAGSPAIPDYDPGWNRQQILENTLDVYRGGHPTVPPVSAEFVGKVLCGYQGWFSCPGDGVERGWHHWAGRRGFRPGSCSIDLWPDVRELDVDERFDTPFQHRDQRVAQVYSPLNAKTVDRHFAWMQKYGIDGVMVQRFGTEIRSRTGLYHFNRVLRNCQAGANHHGRVWAVMYDLSGLGAGDTELIRQDWKDLVDRMKLGRDPGDSAYLQHEGRPLVAIWGVGFSDRRRYSLDECESLIRFLKEDPTYGGNAVMLGVPSYWREGDHDAVGDPQLKTIIQLADVISPWSVGRYSDQKSIQRYAKQVWQPDLQWCKEESLDYLPVVFPGFSWHNMHPDSELGAIPRRGGNFFWEQVVAARRAGAETLYVAMFDEMDEGTAIFKCSEDPPGGESRFLDFEGQGSDFYLWLTGQAGEVLRSGGPMTDEMPKR